MNLRAGRPAPSRAGPWSTRPSRQAAALCCALTSGCGGHSWAAATPPEGTATRPSPTATLSPVRTPPSLKSTVSPWAPAEASPEFIAAAGAYLAARENAISFHHATSLSWLAEARPLMTPAGWVRLSASLEDSSGWPAATAHTNRWSVHATTTCRHDPEVAQSSHTQATLTCTMTDRTIDAAGRPVPAKALPGIWPYTGPQRPAVLSLRSIGGRWLVDDDQTGGAG